MIRLFLVLTILLLLVYFAFKLKQLLLDEKKDVSQIEDQSNDKDLNE